MSIHRAVSTEHDRKNAGRDLEGEPMATLKDVAQKAGVSPSTASGALRGLSYVKPDTAERVLKAAHDLDYTINASARALRSGRTGIFSLIIPTVDVPFYSMLTSAMERCVERHGYQLIVEQNDFDAKRERCQIERQDDNLSEGMFLLTTQTDTHDVVRLIGDHPTVLFEDYDPDILVDAVNVASNSGIDRAIRHLVECGRTRICLVGTSLPLARPKHMSNSGRTRYERGLAATQVFDALDITDTCGAINSDWGSISGIKVGHRIAETVDASGNLRYNAVCCMNDDLALGVIRGLADRDVRVPDDVAVTGFDGIRQGEWSVPTLTTIALDYDGMAETAVSMMLRKFSSTPISFPQRVTGGFRLLPRQSTAVGAR